MNRKHFPLPDGGGKCFFCYKIFYIEWREVRMAMEQIPVLELLWNLISRNTENISRVHYFPQKPAFPREKMNEVPLPRAIPESQGISSEKIEKLLCDLENGTHTHIHQFMILRNGKVITECGFAPYDKELWHASYSLCKSITGTAIGMLIDEGKLQLEDRILDVLKKPKNLISFIRQKDLKIKHLLTMSSGVSFNETGVVSGNEWVKSFLESSVHFTPGTCFEYNSMNSYILSAVVTEITGETMMEYLRPRLWEPLGITRVFWETCPKGITKGGWGLFLRAEDAAKIGQLYLQNGQWNGRQLLSETWIRQSTSPQIEVPEKMGFGGYGYQIWMGERPESYVFNGMLGQNVLVYPDLQMVIVTNAGNSTLFQCCEMLDIIHNYFPNDYIPETSLSSNVIKYRKLQKTIARLEGRQKKRKLFHDGIIEFFKFCRKKRITKSFLEKLDGKKYQMKEQHVGIFPLVLQVFHNNYTDGIENISFQKKGKDFYILLKEGDFSHRLRLGICDWAENEIQLHGEIYQISVFMEMAKDEDERTVLKIEIAFLEDAATRKLKIFFKNNDLKEIEIRWTEHPGTEMIFEGLNSITGSMEEHPVLKGIKEKRIMDLLWILINQTVEPVTKGVLEISN